MNGLIIASYVLRAQQQARFNDTDYLSGHEAAVKAARRMLVSLAAVFVGVGLGFSALNYLG